MPPVAVVPSTFPDLFAANTTAVLFLFKDQCFSLRIMDERTPTSLQEQKRLLRAEMREKRHASTSVNPQYAQDLTAIFLDNVPLEKGAIVASYYAFRDEADPAELNKALRARGHRIALPFIVGKKEPLRFRLYEEGDQLFANPMGIFEPASAAIGVEPDVLLIPMLAFDAARNRLGYGGGYYDRTIAKLRKQKTVHTIGISYAYQEVPKVPTGRNDIQLNTIVTNLRFF